jgi:hypothetical protein
MQHGSSSRRWLICIVSVAAVVFLIKITLALKTYGTNDVLFWEADLEKIRHDGAVALYRDGAVLYRGTIAYHTEKFNQPPFMVWVYLCWGWLEDVSGLPFRFWLRLSSSLADVLSLPLLVAILRRSRIPCHPVLLLMVAAAPISLLVSGFHGNADAVMMAFVLLSLFLLETGRPVWAAGAALGMAMNIKIVPVIFVPAICLLLGTLNKQAQMLAGAAAVSNRGTPQESQLVRERVFGYSAHYGIWSSFLQAAKAPLQFLGAAVLVFILGSIPIIIQAPALVMSSVFGYKSLFGYWGFSLIATGMRDGPAHWLFELYSAAGRSVLFLVIAAASIYINTRKVRTAPARQFGLIAFLFMALTPGFGAQYLAWLIPWTMMLDVPAAFAFHVTSGIFLVASYNHAAGGYPWYLADSTTIQPGGIELLAGIPCWLTICYIALDWLTGISVDPSSHAGRLNATVWTQDAMTGKKGQTSD